MTDTETMLLDFPAWLGSQDEATRATLAQHFQIADDAGTGEAERLRMVNMRAVVDAVEGVDPDAVRTNWDIVRAGYAEQRGGAWLAARDDDARFNTLLKFDAEKRRDERRLIGGPDDVKAPDAKALWEDSLVKRARDAAYKGAGWGEAFADWQSAKLGAPGYDDTRANDYADIARREHERMTAAVARARPVAEQAAAAMTAARDTGEGNAAPFELFRGLAPEEKRLAFQLMEEGAKGGADKGFWQATGEALGRGFENIALGGGAAAFRERLLRSQFAAGSRVSADNATDEVRQQFAAEAVARMSPNTGGGVRQTRVLTAEEATQWNEQIATALDDLDTAEELRKFGQDVIDPVDKAGGFVRRKLWLPALESAALMASMAIPGGAIPALELNARSYQNDEYQRLRGLGMEAGEANRLSLVTGIGQSALDKAQLGLLKGVPGVKRVLEKFAMAGNWGLRFGVNTVLTTGAETAVELAQDQLVPALVQDNFASDPRFDVRWGDVWRETIAAAPETALGMVLLSGIGGVYQTASQSAATRALADSPAAMRARGYTMEQIAEIQKAPADERGALLSQYLPAKAPEGAERAKLISEAITLAERERAAFAEKQRAAAGASADAQDYALRVTRSAAGWFVTYADKSIRVDSAEAAAKIRDDLKQTATQQEADDLIAAVDSWSNRGEGRVTQFTGEVVQPAEGGTQRTRLKTGESRFEAMDETTLNTLHEEAMMDAQTTGHVDLAGVVVNGSNTLFREKVADGADRLTQRLEVNASESALLTFLHEAVESDWRAGLTSGAITREETQRAIAGLAPAFDPQTVSDSGRRAMFERVQKVARGEASETELRETLSELAVADILGRNREGGIVPAGSVSRALESAIRETVDPQAVRELGKVRAFFRAVKQYFRGLFGTVAALRKARRTGGAESFDALLAKVTGADGQSAFDLAAKEEATSMLPDYVPPSDEDIANGIAFRLGRAVPADASRTIVGDNGTTVIGPTTFAIRAYHGTPHKVDRFSLDKIGTGEGAQVYGWGLYFAENPEVANAYKSALGKDVVVVDGKEVDLESLPSAQKAAYSAASIQGVAKTLQDWEGRIADGEIDPQDSWFAEFKSTLEGLASKAIGRENKGAVYTVTLDVEPEDLLDWDKPLSEQSEKVREAMAVFDPEMYSPDGGDYDPSEPGQISYNRLASELGQEGASKRLAEYGIPGIRYLDQGSRGSSAGTYNFVLFDESRIRITEENGKPVAPSAFRLSAGSRVEAMQRRIDATLARDPQARRNVARRAVEKLQALQFNWETLRYTGKGDEIQPVTERRTVKELDKEQAVREAIRAEELERAGMATLSANTLQALEMGGQKFADGFLASTILGEVGRLMSRTEAAKLGLDNAQEYDGAPWLPWQLWGGNIRPDEAAQILADMGILRDARPDTLWQALEKEMQSVAKANANFQAARKAVREVQRQARNQAKEEAANWRAEQDQRQAKDWSPRASLVRDLRALEAITSVLPAEVRGKIGGSVKLATLGSDQARLAEIGKRITKIDRVLERYLQDELTSALGDLLDKAAPKREAGKQSRGKLGADGHRYFDNVAAVLDLTAAEVEGERAKIAAAYAADGLTDEQAAELFEQEQILDTFGAWKEKTAAGMDKALTAAEAVYRDGRNYWRTIEEARLARVGELAAQALEILKPGNPYLGITEQRTGGLGRTLRNGLLDLKSFGEVMEAIFGKSDLARYFARGARNGFAAKNDELRAFRKRFREALEKATGARGLDARRMLWDMANTRTVAVQNAGQETTKTDTVPVATIDAWRDGTADPAALGITPDEADALKAERAAMAPDDRRKGLPLTRANRGEAAAVNLTEAEALFVTMLAAQEGYADALDKAGWTADAVASLEGQLSDAAKALREFMRAEYRDGYTPLAAVFESMFGVALPQIRNYAPAAFYHVGEERADGPEERGGFGAGMRAGFLANRKRHTAMPKLENAFATLFGHVEQSAHWKALAPFVRELSGVLGRPDVKAAVEAAHGKEALAVLSQWIEAIQGNGLQVKSGILDGFAKRLATARTYVALAWNLGTMAKQSSALLGAAWKLPVRAYARGFAKLMTGQLDTAAVWASPVIQRRLETGFAPEVRAVLNDAFTAKPTRRAEFLERGMEVLGLVDAFFTTGSAAIAYDYHFSEAKASGLTDAAAATVAMREVERIVSETAQPADAANRSLFELRQGAFGRLLFMFASEARQKSSLWLTAWQNTLTGKATKDDVRVLVLSHLIVEPMMQAITAAWRDARSDDDDELFDAENWKPRDFLVAATLGPLAGVPLLNDLVSAASGYSSSGIFGRRVFALSALKTLFTDEPGANDPEKAEWYLDRIVRVLGGMDAFTATAAKLLGQGADVVDNLVTTGEEAAKQARKKAAREAREAKK